MIDITVYFDYTDPWCYVALFKADWLRSQIEDANINWYPFELFPELPPRGSRPRNPAFWRRKIQYDVDEMVGKVGRTVHVPSDWVTNSRLALEGGLFARDHGHFDAYHRGVFEAYFERHRDIGQVETIVAIGASAGLPEEPMRKALTDRVYTSEIVRLRDAAEELGVVAVPTLICAGRGVVGIVADERLLQIVGRESAQSGSR